MAAHQEKNKEIVKQFLETTFNQKNVQKAADMVSDRFIQHDPHHQPGRDGFTRTIPEMFSRYPTLQWTMKRIWADEDYVIVQSHYQFAAHGKGTAAVDIFRIKDGKIDEHWDAMQDIPEKTANPNSVF